MIQQQMRQYKIDLRLQKKETIQNTNSTFSES